MNEIRAKAEELGVPTKGKRKTDLILDIQNAEENELCFGTNNGKCQYTDCCFWDDCKKANKRKC